MNKTFGKYVLILGLLLVLLITACSPKEDEEPVTEDKEDDVAVVEVEEEKEEQEEEPEAADESLLVTDAPPAPTNLAELIAYPVGQFAGRDYEENAEEIEKVLSGFPRLTSEEPTEEEVKAYWEMILPLFAEDYPDPVNIVKKWEAFSFGSPESDDPRLQFKENYNVEIILDASGSMGAYVGSKTRMELAKDAIREFAQGLPEEANVGLRVYGHEGSGSDADKELSCNSNELVYDIQSYDEKALNESMDKFKPAGWTPLAEAITLAMEDLREYSGEQNTNIIYIVSDGIETCDGDPIKAAESLAQSDITPIVNVIGLDVNSEGQEQL